MTKKHKLRYSDLGKPEFSDLVGEVELILTCAQAKLLRRFVEAQVDPTPGIRSQLTYLLLHLKVLITYPRLFWLAEYYNPEDLDLAGFEPVNGGNVRLTFFR